MYRKVVNILGSYGGHFTIVFFLKKWKFVRNVIFAHPQCILPHVGILQTPQIMNYKIITTKKPMLLLLLLS